MSQPHSGKHCIVNGVSHLTNWQVSDILTSATHVTSATAGGTDRSNGISDWTGNYTALGPQPIALPGQSIAFQGYTAPDDDVEGSEGNILSGNALVESVVINWNWGTNESISHTVNFAGNGPLTHAIGAPPVDAAAPKIWHVCNLKVEYGTDVATSPTILDDITTIGLTINSALQTSNTSSAFDAGTGFCWTTRRAGPIDWTMAIGIEASIRQLAKGSNQQFRLWVTATEYWELVTGKVLEMSNITCDRGGPMVAFTENVGMKASDIDSSLGRIVTPDNTLYWGEAA